MGIQPDIVSAIGAIPKKDSDEVRLIHDCSRPVGCSLNSHATIDKQKFQTLDEATQLISPRAYMAKVDLKSAYRSVPIHPFSMRRSSGVVVSVFGLQHEGCGFKSAQRH